MGSNGGARRHVTWSVADPTYLLPMVQPIWLNPRGTFRDRVRPRMYSTTATQDDRVSTWGPSYIRYQLDETQRDESKPWHCWKWLVHRCCAAGWSAILCAHKSQCQCGQVPVRCARATWSHFPGMQSESGTWAHGTSRHTRMEGGRVAACWNGCALVAVTQLLCGDHDGSKLGQRYGNMCV